MNDLVCVVADNNLEAVVSELLGRPESLGIRSITRKVIVHPQRDPGCFRDGVTFLRGLIDSSEHGLIVFDHAWKGVPEPTGERLEDRVNAELNQAGLGQRARAIVIDPELEAWVFSTSPHVARILGWSDRSPTLRRWLESEQLWEPGASKPSDPKEALERALYRLRRPRSSSIYRDLAKKVGVKNCTDPAFTRLKAVLRAWFPPTRTA